MIRPYLQKWWMNPGDRVIGARIQQRNAGSHKRHFLQDLTIDVYWWWGGVMLWFGQRRVS